MTIIINEFELVIEPQNKVQQKSPEAVKHVELTPQDIKKIIDFFQNRSERLRAD